MSHSIIGWIVVGGLAGWLGAVVVGSKKRGCFLSVAVGVIGAIVGGVLFRAAGMHQGSGFVWSLFVAFVGSVFFLLVLQLFGRRRR